MKTNKKKVGDIGEQIALNFMLQKGYELVERNYLKKHGEIDLVLTQDKKIFFIEVKTCKKDSQYGGKDNLTSGKLKRFERTGELYIQEKKLERVQYFFMAIVVTLDQKGKKAEIELVEDLW